MDGRVTEPEPGQEREFAWIVEHLRERYVVKNYNVGGVWGYRHTPAEVVDFWLHVDPIEAAIQTMRASR